MTESTPPEGPTPQEVEEARDALARPHDEEDASGTTRDAGNQPDSAGEESARAG